MPEPELAHSIGAARRIIALAPQDAGAHRRLAQLLNQAGDHAAAVTLLQRSLELEPDNARALNNLGNLLTGQGRPEEAISVLRRALERQPDYPAALVNLGVALARMDRLDDAIDHYRRALALNPRLTEGTLNMASAHARARRHEEALVSFDRTLRLAPGLLPAHVGRVHALLALRRPADALAACDALLALDTIPPGTRSLRAVALLALDRVPEAQLEAARAAAEDPQDVQACIALGLAALRTEAPQAALTAFETAARLAPAFAKAHAGRAGALDSLGRATEAIEAYEEAARLDPNDIPVLLNGGMLMLKVGFGTAALAAFEAVLLQDGAHMAALRARALTLLALGRHEEAGRAFTELQSRVPGLDYLAGYVFNLRLWSCDWTDYESARVGIAACVDRGERADVPLSFIAHTADPAAQRRCANVFVADQCAVKPGATSSVIAARDHSRLRIGYLSYDLRNHPVAQLAVGLFESHDRSRFEIYGFSAAMDDGSALRQRLRAAFDRFEDVSGVSDERLAERIAALGIDVLVDLGGHSLGSRTRALAYRPAPVQISFLGFPGTLGASFVDYIVADRQVIPEEERIHYSEQVIYMPDTYLPFDFTSPPPASLGKREAGLPDGSLVFCCFNSPFKLTPDVFGDWMRVLQAVPTAVLWLRDGSPAMKRNLAREALARGVDPHRLIYAPRMATTAEHMARFALADVFLDTTPYNAHTTAAEALSIGVPVITRRGRTYASRVATSLLHAVDLGHLSVANSDEYTQLAIDLARSPATLAASRAHLQRVRSQAPLFDTRLYCHHLEAAFVEAARRAQRKERPTLLSVERQTPR